MTNFVNLKSEKLFSELTPEQGAVIDGGGIFILDKIEATTTGADGDRGGGDDVYFKFNGVRFDIGTFVTGDSKNFPGYNLSFDDSAKFELFDSDRGSRDDRLGSLTDSVLGSGSRTATLWGSGSIYDVTYRVVG